MTHYSNDTHPRDDSLRALRAAQDRSFRSEGIPMFLAVVPRTEVAAQSPAVRGDGGALADAADEVRRTLFPSGRDGDMGALISTLQALSIEHFMTSGEDQA